MAVGIVDLLEVIEVDHQQRQRGVVAQGTLHFRRDALGERPAIQQLRERIGLRELLESGVVGHRALDHLRALDHGHGRGDHRLREFEVVRPEAFLIARTTHEEYAILTAVDRERQRDHRADRHFDAFNAPHVPHAFVQRVGVEIFHQHRLSGLERRLQFGIAIELDAEMLQPRVFERRHHDGLRVARPRQHHGTVRHAQRARRAAHEQVEEFGDREVPGYFVQNVHELATAVGILLRAHERFLRAREGKPRGAQHGPRTQLGLNARQQLFRAIRLANEICRAQPQRPYRRVLGRLRGQHEHRQIAPALFALDPLEQLTSIGIRHEDVEEQQIGRALLELFKTGHPAVGGNDLVSIFLQQPGDGFEDGDVIVRDENSGDGHQRTLFITRRHHPQVPVLRSGHALPFPRRPPLHPCRRE